MDTPLTLPDPVHVVVCEYDCDREWRLRNGHFTPNPMGPVMQQTYLTRTIGRDEAMLLQERLGHKFGRTAVMRLVPARSTEQVRSDFEQWFKAEYPTGSLKQVIADLDGLKTQLWQAYRAASA